MRYRARLEDWNDDKGFGFVQPAGQDERVFVHIKAFSARPRRPQNGDVLVFVIERDPQGRARAAQVRFDGATAASPSADAWSRDARPASAGRPVPRAFALAFLVVLGAVTVLGRLPVMVAMLYVTTSGLAFIVYAFDKAAAMQRRWRIPEQTLLLLGLAGGWPGAVFAQHSFRHKSRKTAFQVPFWATVVLNCGAFAYVLTPAGRRLLSGLLQT